MTGQEVAQAALPENLAGFNLKLSTNMNACVHMQPWRQATCGLGFARRLS